MAVRASSVDVYLLSGTWFLLLFKTPTKSFVFPFFLRTLKPKQHKKKRVQDSEFAACYLSTRILRFGNLEAKGGLRKTLPIKLRGTNIVEKKRQKDSPTKGLVMVRSSVCITCGMVVQTICQCRRKDIWLSNSCAICVGVWDWKWHSEESKLWTLYPQS